MEKDLTLIEEDNSVDYIHFSIGDVGLFVVLSNDHGCENTSIILSPVQIEQLKNFLNQLK